MLQCILQHGKPNLGKDRWGLVNSWCVQPTPCNLSLGLGCMMSANSCIIDTQCARASKIRHTLKLAEPSNCSLFQDLCSVIWGLHINHLTVTCLEAFYLDIYFLYFMKDKGII